MIGRITRLIMVIAVLTTCFAAHGEMLTGNVLPNATVEDSVAVGEPTYWHHSPYRPAGITDRSTAKSVSATHSLCVADNSTTSGIGAHWRSHARDALPGASMRFQWYWQYNNVTADGILVAVRFFSGNPDTTNSPTGIFLGQSGLVATGTKNTWEKQHVDFTVPIKAKSMDVMIFHNSDAVTGEIWCDDLSLARLRPISLEPTLKPSAVRDVTSGPITLLGETRDQGTIPVRIRVTTTQGAQSIKDVTTSNGLFQAVYPTDFPGAPPLQSGMLFLDATTDANFIGNNQAEAGLLLYDSQKLLIPEMPTVFTNDLCDKQGRTDANASEWPVVRTLANLYQQSLGAATVGIGWRDFDLAKPSDFKFFKDRLTLYDFDHRDRNWATPLSHRETRTFWQSVYNAWFNSSNDHPIDGNPANGDFHNYVPYGFSNDYADTLIMYNLRLHGCSVMDDNLVSMCREGTQNLLAMQHKDPSNFSLMDSHGVQHTYTAGAFRYGMFDTGDFMSEGNGWFHNPSFKDYYDGGVLNGRCVWGLATSLQQDPQSPLAPQIKQAIQRASQFCLRDALAYGYAKKTTHGNTYWRDAGEHGYLAMGLVNAASVDPNLMVAYGDGPAAMTLREACVGSLNALVDLQNPRYKYWSTYPNVDPMAIVALVDGASLIKDNPASAVWLATAVAAADSWLAVRVDPKDYPADPMHYGLRTGNTMTYNWTDHNFIFLYQNGHWMHALAQLYKATKNERYRKRIEDNISYLCGANPWGLRLLTETGGVYNWVEDKNLDGVEDELKYDLYPESTAFCQIGIMYYMRVLAFNGAKTTSTAW